MFHSKECVNNVRVKMFNFLKKSLGCFEFFLLLAMMTPQNAIAFKHVARYVQELCKSLSARLFRKRQSQGRDYRAAPFPSK